MNIQAIIQMAKEHILETGSFEPAIFISYEGMNELAYCILVIDAETTFEKEKALFASGREMGISQPGRKIAQLCMVNEAWVSSYKPDEKRRAVSPSQDPNRREVLLAITLDVASRKFEQWMYIIEMIRDGMGNLVDLLPSDEPCKAESMLLPSFLAGFVSAKMSDRELSNMARKYKRNV